MNRAVIADLRERPEALAAEYVDLCHELGCIVRPGLALEFAKKMRQRLGEAHARESELIRMWDRASPTERQELDRMRRGWGPSSPTERERRRGDVASCLQALSIAMSDLTVGEDEADSVPEEARDRLDEAYGRISKQHAAVAGILHALVADPQEWPDIVAAEERGEARARAAESREATAVARAERLEAALRPFCFGDPTLERILYDGMPDTKTGTFTISLGDIRRARTALSPESQSAEGAGQTQETRHG